MLRRLADSIRNNKNILEKMEINPLIQYIEANSFKSKRIFSGIGEDAAAIYADEKYMLITTDRIKTDFIENFPYGAGFSAILVSVDDIYACGGVPIAASTIISFKDIEVGNKILEGLAEGSRKFQVPIIRGHTNPNAKCYELSSTIVGEIKKDFYISAMNARINDNVILALDFDGKPGKASKFFYDTTTFKNSDEVLRKRKAMNIIAENKLVNASKDVSNGGIFGTLLQMAKFSNVGVDININKIEVPPNLLELGYTLENYIEMYLTTAFVLTAPQNNCSRLIHIFKEYGLHAKVIGKIIKEKNLLKLNDGKDSVDVIRF